MALLTRGGLDNLPTEVPPSKSKDTQTVVAQAPSQMPGIPDNFARQDWGLAICICLTVGFYLFQLYRKQQADEAAQNKQLTLYLIKQNQSLQDTLSKMLVAFLERKS